MKQVLVIIISLVISLSGTDTIKANLPPGSPAQDFTVTDINGQTYNLYTLLNAGKTVYIEFAATWCIFCWNYHNTNILQDFYNQYGPNGTNEVMVLFLEAELNNTHDCLYGASTCVGPKGGTKGDWVSDVPFPIFDLQQSDASIIANYQQIGFPTIYCICPQTKTAYEVGQASVSELYSYVTSCQLDYQLVNKTNLLCKGDHSGSIDISSTSGIPPLSYLWSNGATTEDINGLNAGTYRLTITDANGVKKVTSNITITEPAALVISTNQLVNEGCEGTNGGSVNINSLGGVPAYSYAWSNGSVTEDISGLAAGSYSVTLTDHNGCFTSKSYTLSSFKNPTSDAGNDKTINCIYPTAVLEGDGDFTAQYKWTTSNGHIVSGATTLYPLVDKGGNYTLTVKYASTGCSASDEMSVIQNTDQTKAIIKKPEDINCKNIQVSIDATQSSSGTNIIYDWYTDNGNIVGGENANILSVNEPGIYKFIIQNTLSYCKDSAYVTVNKDTIKPIANAGNNAELNCKVDTLMLNGSQSSQGQNIFIHWTTLNGNIISGDSTVSPKVNKEGIYKLTVANIDNACSSTAYDTVARNPASLPISVFNFTNQLLSVYFHDFSSGIPETYSWDFGDGTNANEQNPMHNYIIDGNYSVCLTTTNLCGNDTLCQNLTVSNNTNIPSITNISINNVTCRGGSDGCIDLTVIYGTAPYTYNWSNGSKVEDPCLLTASIYSVTVTDANGISITSNNIIVSETNYINIANTVVNDPDCNQTNGGIWLNINSNSTQLNYLWSHDSTLNINEANNLAEGTYKVTISDLNGCSSATSVTLTEKGEKLNTQFSSLLCYGDMTANVVLNIIGGIAPYNIIWNTGDTTKLLNNKGVGIYNCQVTDATGCIKTTQVQIDQPDEIVTLLDVTNSDNGENNGSIMASCTGGISPYTYNWSNGGSTQFINNLAPGDYILTLTDNNSCVKIYTNTIEELTETNYQPGSQLVFNLYPNPAIDNIKVFIKYPESIKSELSITDLLGNLVYKLNSSGEEINRTIDLSAYPPGYYLVKLITDKGSFIKKIGLVRGKR